MSEQAQCEQQHEYEYTVKELLEEAQNDPSWEPDEEKRKQLTAILFNIVQKL